LQTGTGRSGAARGRGAEGGTRPTCVAALLAAKKVSTTIGSVTTPLAEEKEGGTVIEGGSFVAFPV
jgi:hypothetical protein